MAEHVIKLPDVGEGVAEAELVEWNVKLGDLVREDAVLAAVMTDKATVEIPSPVEGRIVWLGAEVGETVPVGSAIIRIEVPGGEAALPGTGAAAKPDGAGDDSTARTDDAPPAPAPSTPRAEARRVAQPAHAASASVPRPEGEKPLASPAVRLRAREAGIDLRQVPGTGPAGRIGHDDLDAFMVRGTNDRPPAGLRRKDGIQDIKMVGLRRRIADRMSLAKSRIPHITYVEEVDVTALEALRAKLNAEKTAGRPKLTILPFLMRAMVKAIAEQPHLNARFDDEAGVIHRHEAIHFGIAAQTPGGLMVPVLRHAEARDIWGCADEAARLAAAARDGSATRDELSGSTITITSLGAMGGVATTPVINYPEVAIIGVNKIMVRPVWDGVQFLPRKMMNLSSSFDHRVIDGWEAAVFVQRLKALLETPALIFVEA